MTTLPRRALSTVLAAALLLGSVPPGAQAQVVRIAAGEAGVMPVSPQGASAKSTILMPPALNIGAASLNGTISAPSAVPAEGFSAIPALIVTVRAAAAEDAPKIPDAPKAAAPVEKKTFRQRVAAMFSRKQAPAPVEAQEATTVEASAENPAAQTPAAENAKAGADVNFDGASERSEVPEGSSVQANQTPLRPSPLKAAAPAGRASKVDDFGGPKLDPSSTNAVRYGVKWGLNMLGISALLNVIVRPIINAIPWPQFLSEKAQEEFGRVVLMTKMGASEITTRIAESPAKFFGLDLPSALVAEEITFRLFGFGAIALFLAALRPASRWIAHLLKGMPDAGGAAGGAEAILKVGEFLSRRAFPIAAAMSAVTFAIAHFAEWGISPFVLISNLVLGLILARTAYAGRALPAPRWAQGVFLSYLGYNVLITALMLTVGAVVGLHLTIPTLSMFLVLSLIVAQLWAAKGQHGGGALAAVAKTGVAVGRGLIAPFTAHLVFNAVTLGAIAVGLIFSPSAALAYTIITGLLGVSALLYNYLSARKERKFKLANGAKALAVLMLAGGSLFLWQGEQKNTPGGSAAAIQQVQHKTETAPAPLITAPLVSDTTKTGTAAVESRADMVARVKPAVVNVIIRMQGGYAIGSGFILTPDGVFITNAHVVGSKQPGDFVNARVPGVKKELRAKVLAVNHDKDLAIVQLEPNPDGKPWTTVKLAAKAPREGEEVTALGYPRGLPFTVTRGVVSGVDGRASMYVRKLQTDAAINPGNSGGPLFNDKGEVIGVNTEIRTESGGSEGLGFSIQAPEVARVMEQYAKTGNIATASLGIIANLSDPAAPDAGLEIEYVRSGSAAANAGLKRGDLIISVGGESIEEGGQEAAGHIASVLSKLTPGTKVSVTVLRGDEPLEFELTVDAKTTAPGH